MGAADWMAHVAGYGRNTIAIGGGQGTMTNDASRARRGVTYDIGWLHVEREPLLLEVLNGDADKTSVCVDGWENATDVAAREAGCRVPRDLGRDAGSCPRRSLQTHLECDFHLNGLMDLMLAIIDSVRSAGRDVGEALALMVSRLQCRRSAGVRRVAVSVAKGRRAAELRLVE